MNVKNPFIIALILVVLITFINGIKHRMLYHPDRTHFAVKQDQVQELFLQNRNGNKLCAWYYSAGEGTKIVLFAHGNAGNLTFREEFMNQFRSHNISYLFFDYRGFGKSTGMSTIDSTVTDTIDWYKYIINTLKYKKEDIVAVGESIGSYPAAKLAEKYKLDKLIILYGLNSLSLTIKHMMPIIYPLVYVFVYNDLCVGEVLKQYKGKTLILHSKTDELVNYENATSNAAINTDTVELVVIQGGHNTPIIDWERVTQFIKNLD
jgi:pimeloyl-ACP methyl ester carboxylesterase